MIKNTCPHCGRILRFRDSDAGEPVNCDRCGGFIIVSGSTPPPGAGGEREVRGDSEETDAANAMTNAGNRDASHHESFAAGSDVGTSGSASGPETGQRQDAVSPSPSLAGASGPGYVQRGSIHVVVKGLACLALLAAVATIAAGLMRGRGGAFDASPGTSPDATTPTLSAGSVKGAFGAAAHNGETPKPKPNAIRVRFADRGLEAAIREAIKRPKGDLFLHYLVGESFTSLDATGRGITNLGGIERCADLTRLDLRDNKIADIAPLNALKKLTWLRLAGNDLRDITPLQELKALNTVGLEGNRISDLRPLGNLPQLTTLSLMNNRVHDIAPLAALRNLEGLLLDDNQISDIAPLSELRNLKVLSMKNNQVADITPLSRLTKLEELTLSMNQIKDVSPLGRLPYLRELEITGNQITDASPLLENIGLNKGDEVNLANNPLEPTSLGKVVSELKARGVTVSL